MIRSGSSVVRSSIIGGLLLGLATAAPALASSPRNGGAVTSPQAWSAPQRVVKGDFDQFSEVVDSHNHVHIAASGGGDLYYVTDRTGTWTHKLLLSHGSKSSWGQPSIALDENDRVHIAVGRFPNGEGDKGIWYLSDVGRARGTFPSTATKIAPTGTGEGALKAAGGHLYLVDVSGWCCLGDGTVELRTNASGSWTVSTVGRGMDPSFGLGIDGRAQVVFDRVYAQRGIYYGRATTVTGGFVTSKIPATSAHDSLPLLAIDGVNRPFVAYRHFTSGGMSIVVRHNTSHGWTDPDTAVSGISAENIVAFDLDTLERANVAYGNVAIRALEERSRTWHASTVATNGRPRWLVLRRALNGGEVVAWTGETGIFVSRR